MGVELVVLFNRLPEIAANLEHAGQVGQDQGLALVEEEAKNNAPVATGGLVASGYRITALTDEYAGAVVEMEARNPAAFDSGPPHVATQSGEGVVGFAADYALPVHDGHHTAGGNFVPADPFLASAAIAHEQDVVDAVATAIYHMILTNSISL